MKGHHCPRRAAAVVVRGGGGGPIKAGLLDQLEARCGAFQGPRPWQGDRIGDDLEGLRIGGGVTGGEGGAPAEDEIAENDKAARGEEGRDLKPQRDHLRPAQDGPFLQVGIEGLVPVGPMEHRLPRFPPFSWKAVEQAPAQPPQIETTEKTAGGVSTGQPRHPLTRQGGPEKGNQKKGGKENQAGEDRHHVHPRGAIVVECAKGGRDAEGTAEGEHADRGALQIGPETKAQSL